MKTIAITIDEATLRRLDRFVAAETVRWRSRSQLIREAVQQLVAHLERHTEEERELEIIRRHGARLNRQATALIKEQAKL